MRRTLAISGILLDIVRGDGLPRVCVAMHDAHLQGIFTTSENKYYVAMEKAARIMYTQNGPS